MSKLQKVPHKIYCDGGVIGRNPSFHGGTWCYCWVDEEGKRIKSASGVVTPQEVESIERITNNFTELLAALKALESVPKDWSGILYTDSKITMGRITRGSKFNGIPNDMRLRTLDIRRNRNYKVVLVAGHPTRLELENGVRARNGLPTSIHNCFCDEECGKRAKDFLGSIKKRKAV